ncbi:hypothetical protein BESB_051580 [Besnoitia besnoiti]|uniref:Uncharacterized protein n=1 Tax=Besnoitia besnoiti TaxID=94643 RepID=A0A2A9MIU5_BESBE|nr:hypothetical protein BESB_051580 [Besnoitia besnoiti]PFH35507.1 hypothetical protein BESB_051580 [Besnoitia besnoiti]
MRNLYWGLRCSISSPLHPLHFQDAWQASEPMPVDIFYKVPGGFARLWLCFSNVVLQPCSQSVYGEGDLADALAKANDKASMVLQPSTSEL